LHINVTTTTLITWKASVATGAHRILFVPKHLAEGAEWWKALIKLVIQAMHE
jgi:hypothetical protein